MALSTSAYVLETMETSGLLLNGYEKFVPSAHARRSVPLVAATGEHGGQVELLQKWRPIADALSEWKTVPPAVRSRLYLLDCGGGGDCLYHVLAAALNQLHSWPLFTARDVRRWASSQLNEKNVELFLQSLHTKPALPTSLKKVDERVAWVRRNLIEKTGIWGSEGVLEYLLLNAPPFLDNKLGFAVIRFFKGAPQTQRFCLPSTQHLITILNYRNEHWLLVGVTPHNRSCDIASCWPLNSYPAPLYVFLRQK